MGTGARPIPGSRRDSAFGATLEEGPPRGYRHVSVPLPSSGAPWVLSRRRCGDRTTGPRVGVALAFPVILGLIGLLGGAGAAVAGSLEDIRQLEDLINAAGVVTKVSDQCPARHAGFYEWDNAGRHRLVLCRNVVNQELRTLAPHYAKLIDLGYYSGDQRLEAEAFWMELQTPLTVINLFRSLCAKGLRRP